MEESMDDIENDAMQAEGEEPLFFWPSEDEGFWPDPEEDTEEQVAALDGPWLAAMDQELKLDNDLAIRKRKAILSFTKHLIDDIKSPNSDTELHSFVQEETTDELDAVLAEPHPHEMPLIAYTVSIGQAHFSVIGSIGDYYTRMRPDVSNSEAFHSGFYTAMMMIKEGLITIDITDKEGNANDNTDS